MRRRALLAASKMNGGVPDTPNEGLDYLTIIPLHEEEMEYVIRPHCQEDDMGNMSQLTPIYYRINGGEWVEAVIPDMNEDSYFRIYLKSGNEMQLKSMWPDVKEDDFYFVLTPIISCHDNVKFNVRGTPLSLIYGDEFTEDSIAYSFCFYELFYRCGGLTEILNPQTFLPSKTIEFGCYAYMFYLCESLINSPELPATTLAEDCYACMFLYCTNLQDAPVLPASTLQPGCYFRMFDNCSKINYIKMMAMDISADDCLYNWVSGVSSTGTFVKHPEATWDVRGVSGVPEGWTIKFDGEEDNIFPATIVYSDFVENLLNVAISQYFLDKYPDMSVGEDGYYTEISEEVQIAGTSYCDGKVVGVSRWSLDISSVFVAFYTESGLSSGYLLRVAVSDDVEPAGSTYEYFFD